METSVSASTQVDRNLLGCSPTPVVKHFLSPQLVQETGKHIHTLQEYRSVWIRANFFRIAEAPLLKGFDWVLPIGEVIFAYSGQRIDLKQISFEFYSPPENTKGLIKRRTQDAEVEVFAPFSKRMKREID